MVATWVIGVGGGARPARFDTKGLRLTSYPDLTVQMKLGRLLGHNIFEFTGFIWRFEGLNIEQCEQ